MSAPMTLRETLERALEPHIEAAAKAYYEADPESGYIAATDGWGTVTEYREWRTGYPPEVWEAGWVAPMRAAVSALLRALPEPGELAKSLRWRTAEYRNGAGNYLYYGEPFAIIDDAAADRLDLLQAAANPQTILALIDRLEKAERERDEARAYVDEQVQERLDEVNAEGEAFDKECVNALRFILKNKCGEAGAAVLDDIDGWSADNAVECIATEITEAWRSSDQHKSRAEKAEAALASCREDMRTIADRELTQIARDKAIAREDALDAAIQAVAAGVERGRGAGLFHAQVTEGDSYIKGVQWGRACARSDAQDAIAALKGPKP